MKEQLFWWGRKNREKPPGRGRAERIPKETSRARKSQGDGGLERRRASPIELREGGLSDQVYGLEGKNPTANERGQIKGNLVQERGQKHGGLRKMFVRRTQQKKLA